MESLLNCSQKELEEKFREFGVLSTDNASLNTNTLNTKELVDAFYDSKTLRKVSDYWEKDLELYYSLK